MLTIGVITLFPELFNVLQYGITGRALQQNLLSLSFWNPRDYAHDKHQHVDDRPYGGGPGMVMLFEPLQRAILAAKATLGETTRVIYLSPQGAPLNQKAIAQLHHQPPFILLCGRYEGIDERLINTLVDEEWSVGDFVVSGGEIPALMLIDAFIRLIPGALHHPQSAINDSFSAGLLDHPHYTRPETIQNQKVPDVLLSGNHQAIARWRLKQSLGKTWQKRPDLLANHPLTPLEKMLLDEYISELTQK